MSIPNRIPFVKMHGCGNDYIYIDCRSRTPDDPAALARRLSDRHFGIGGDGIILICPSQKAEYRMRMFNVDGSEAEMCGNGLRCFAKYLYDRGLTQGESVAVETGAGVLRVQIFPEDGKAARLRIAMGMPRLERPEIPMTGGPGRAINEELSIDVPGESLPRSFRFTAVSMGNPHCVIYVDRTDDFPVAVYGPFIEHHPLFPRRANVEFVQVLTSDEVKMRVWERGAQETLACGTGASAVGVAGVLTGRTGRHILVRLLGGDLAIDWSDDGCVYLTGPAEEVFEGTVAI